MRRISSPLRTRVVPAGESFPLISTSGGLPGEKKRSLIFVEVFNMAVSNSGVEVGAAAGAVATLGVRGRGFTGFVTAVAGEDIRNNDLCDWN
jgi:hypothetical protein